MTTDKTNKEFLQEQATLLNDNNSKLNTLTELYNNLKAPVSNKYAPRILSFYKYTGTSIGDKLVDIDMTNCVSMYNFLCNVTSIKDLVLTNLDTSKVQTMDYFTYCGNFFTIDMSGCKTPKLESTISMFAYNANLTNVNIKDFDFSSMKNMSYMFMGCKKLSRIDMSNIDFSTIPSTVKVTDMFRDVPGTCSIIVKDETAKTWFTNNGFGNRPITIKS